jgi:hypothetical protein
MWVQVLHLLLLLPMILYVGWQMENEKPIHEYTPRILMAIGGFGILYHSYRLFTRSGGASGGDGGYGGYDF